MRAFLLLLIVGASLSYLTARRVHVEQDLLLSLDTHNPAPNHELFRWFESAGPFRNSLFIRLPPGGSLPPDTQEKLATAGYLADSGNINPQIGMKLLPVVSAEKIIQRIATTDPQGALQKFYALAAVPGGHLLIENFLRDPMDLTTLLQQELATVRPPVSETILSMRRNAPLAFDQLAKLEKSLTQAPQKIAWIGGDFFALANYQAIQHDIWFCTVVSSVLCLLVFCYFCRRFELVLLLLGGTWVSYVFGTFLLTIAFPVQYAIVFAFTSTFIGFNNEYLIHLSGINRAQWRHAITGLGSAIGTTLIGFLALLMTPPVIAKQFALIGIGGMMGFIAVMLIFQRRTQTIRFKEISLPKYAISPRALAVVWVIGLGTTALLWPKIRFETNIEDFRYTTPLLQKNLQIFENLLTRLSLGEAYAFRLTDWPDLEKDQALQAAVKNHPIHLFVAEKMQKERLAQWQSAYREKYALLRTTFRSAGVALPAEPTWLLDIEPLTLTDYLKTWSELTAIPLVHEVQGNIYSFLYSPHAVSHPKLVTMSPKSYYNHALSLWQHEMLKPLLISMAIMFIYLIPWQRRLSKVFYVFTPLLLSIAVLLLFLVLFQHRFNLIHLMGMILVLALALDYSSIMISANHAAQEQSKILLTGLASLICFGSLLGAWHPVMMHLGVTVFIGTAVSLLFTLFVRLRETHAA